MTTTSITTLAIVIVKTLQPIATSTLTGRLERGSVERRCPDRMFGIGFERSLDERHGETYGRKRVSPL